jgi:sensor c-di-GMP phosphodiesterase-like protein
MQKETSSHTVPLESVRQLVMIVGVLAAVGAIVAGVLISYRQGEGDCYQELMRGTNLWGGGCSFVFDAAEAKLSTLAKELPGKPLPEIQAALRQMIFDRPIFREAGWIVDGMLVCTSFAVQNPPIAVRPQDLVTNGDRLCFLPPTDTTMGGRSMIVNRRVDDHTIVNVLIAPDSLVLPLKQAMGNSPSELSLVREDGSVVLSSNTTDHAKKVAVPPLGASHGPMGLTFCEHVGNSGLLVVATMPSSQLLENWKRRLPVTGMLSVIAALLFLFGTWQLRERFFGLRAEIRQAAALLQFQPYFQPVINVRTGACEGAELLVRWIHPKRGVVAPGLFIPEAEASGLIEDLTLSMLRRESVAIRDLLRKYDELHLNLNLSATMLDDERFITRLAEALGDLNIVRRFHFELTESVSADESARRRLMEYKEFGVRLAVDDFGTGYSNLRYLKDFPFDYLKIDKAFVDGISSASESSGLIDSIIVIGKSCGMHLIAEGVERKEQLDYLRTHDVQSAQGYYISRPVPIEDFAKWLEVRKAAS